MNQFLPKLAPTGDDGNYALSVSSDLVCLQVGKLNSYGPFGISVLNYGKYIEKLM